MAADSTVSTGPVGQCYEQTLPWACYFCVCVVFFPAFLAFPALEQPQASLRWLWDIQRRLEVAWPFSGMLMV